MLSSRVKGVESENRYCVVLARPGRAFFVREKRGGVNAGGVSTYSEAFL